MVRREAGIGQRRGIDQIEFVRHRNEEPGVGDQHVFGHATVQPDATSDCTVVRVKREVAVVVSTFKTGATVPTTPRTVDRNAVSHLPSRHAGTELINSPSVLVAQGHRWPPLHRAFREFIHEVEVGVAGTGRCHFDHHSARAGRRHRSVRHQNRI